MTHPDWIDGAVMWWIYSAVTANLPEPAQDERWYRFLYKTLQALGANFPPFLQARTGVTVGRIPDTSTTVVLK